MATATKKTKATSAVSSQAAKIIKKTPIKKIANERALATKKKVNQQKKHGELESLVNATTSDIKPQTAPLVEKETTSNQATKPEESSSTYSTRSNQTQTKRITLPPYETVALVLQGGGALGAYQAGVYQGLHEVGIEPNWLAGISIGAITTAIIAGNPPETRVEKLEDFWETICQSALGTAIPPFLQRTFFNASFEMRKWITALQAISALTTGQQGFFAPRFPPPLPTASTIPDAISYYDTAPLKATLERLCDFDRINSYKNKMRVSIGAVNVKTGNFAYFDNTEIKLRAEHFMASGALPPGFAAVEIDGEYYWDGGLMSNTPLARVLQTKPRRDTLAFQIDLWSAAGVVPDNFIDVTGRTKDIQFSSRTRMTTDILNKMQHFRHVMREILDTIPQNVRRNNEWCKVAEEMACDKRYNVVHLIYQHKDFESHYKDFQFGRPTMHAHWQSGLEDINETLQHKNWFDMPSNQSSFITHDIHRLKTKTDEKKG